MAIFKRDKDKAEKDVKIGNRFFPSAAQQAEYEKTKKELAELPPYGAAIWKTKAHDIPTAHARPDLAATEHSPPPLPVDLQATKIVGHVDTTVLVRRGSYIQGYNVAEYEREETASDDISLFDLIVAYHKAVHPWTKE